MESKKILLIDDLLINIAGYKVSMTEEQVVLLLKLTDKIKSKEIVLITHTSTYDRIVKSKHVMANGILSNTTKVDTISSDTFISHSFRIWKRGHINFITKKGLLDWIT